LIDVTRCPNCAHPLDNSSIFQCPHCHIDIPTYIRVNLENLKKSQDYLTGYKQRIDVEVDRKVTARVRAYTWTLAVFIFAGLLTIYIMNQALTEKIVSSKLTQHFRQPELRQALSEQAKAQTREVITKAIRPEIDEARKTAQQEFGTFKAYLEESKAKVGQEYDTLAAQISMLKMRNYLAGLANRAIADGDRKAFDELENASRNPVKVDLAEVAAAEVMRVKAFYATTTRLKDQSVTYANSQGIPIIDDKIPTATLLADLQHNADWRVRAKFAIFLANRREPGVADTLLGVAGRDQNLNVVKASLEAFSSLTGFTMHDVFDYASCEKWWQSNRQS
jgi:hypothetical protein